MSTIFILQYNSLIEIIYNRFFPSYKRKPEEPSGGHQRVFSVEEDGQAEIPLKKAIQIKVPVGRQSRIFPSDYSQPLEQSLDIKYGGKRGRIEIEQIFIEGDEEQQQRFQRLAEYKLVESVSEAFQFMRDMSKRGDQNLISRVQLDEHIENIQSDLIDHLGKADSVVLKGCSSTVIQLFCDVLRILDEQNKPIKKFVIKNVDTPSNTVVRLIAQSQWFQKLKQLSFQNSKLLGNQSLQSFLNKYRIFSLNISGTQVDGAGILSIATSQHYLHLQELNFKGITKKFDKLVEFLSIKSNLEKLKFDLFELTETRGLIFRFDQILNFRRNFLNLKTFDYSGSGKETLSMLNINPSDFNHLTQLVLSNLQLQWMFFQRFHYFAFRQKLNHLDIIDCHYSEAMVQCFLEQTSLPELRFLAIRHLNFRLLCNSNNLRKLQQVVLKDFNNQQYYPYIEHHVLTGINRIVFKDSKANYQDSLQGDQRIKQGFLNPKFFRDFVKINDIKEVILNAKIDNFILFYLLEGNPNIIFQRVGGTYQQHFNSVGLKKISQLISENKMELSELRIQNSLYISQHEIQKFFAIKTGFHQLQIIDFSGSRITNEAINNLSQQHDLYNLQRLYLRDCTFLNFENVETNWKSTNSLWEIDLRGSSISDLGFEQIGELNVLKTLLLLRVENCRLIGQNGIEGFIRSISNRTFGSVSANFNFNETFRSFQSLFDDKIIKDLLSNCVQFSENSRELDFSEMMQLTPQKMADLAEQMLSFPQVQRLIFIRSNLDDQSLIAFFYSDKFPSLQTIKCSSNFTSISASLIDEIQFNPKTPQFDYADFWKENRLSIDDNFLTSVYQQNPKITWENFSFLDISHTVKMTQEGLANLLGYDILLANISYLDISYSHIDDEWVKMLCKNPIMPNLKNIELAQCPFITKLSLITISRCDYFSEDFNLEMFFQQCSPLIDNQVLWEMSFSKYFYNIRKMVLNNNYNVESGLNSVFDSLKRLLPIKILNLNNTNISSKTLEIISISHYLKDLQILSFTHCNRVDKHGIIKLIEGHNYRLKPLLNINNILTQDPTLIDEVVISYLVESDYFHTLNQFDFTNMTNFKAQAFRRLIGPLSEKGNIKFFNFKRRLFFDRIVNQEFSSVTLKSLQHLRIMANPILNPDLIVDGIFTNLQNFPNLNMDIFLFDNQTKVIKILHYLSQHQKITHPVYNLNLKGNQLVTDDSLMEFINSLAGQTVEYIDISETTLVFDNLDNDDKKDKREFSKQADDAFHNPFALSKKQPISFSINQNKKGIAGSLIQALTIKSKLHRLQGLRVYDIPALNTSHINLLLEASNYNEDFNMEQILLNQQIVALLDDRSIELIGKSPYLQNLQILNFSNNQLISNKGFANLARESFLFQIKHLNLRQTLLRIEELQDLMSSPYIKNLIKLRIQNKQVNHGFRFVAESEILSDSFDAEFFFSQKNTWNISEKILERLQLKKVWLERIKEIDLKRALTLNNKKILEFLKSSELQNIISLHLESTKINNENAFIVKQESDLKKEDINSLKDIMILISQMKYLGTFNMNQCNAITFAGLIRLLENPTLNHIVLKTQTTIGSLTTMLQIFDTITSSKREVLSNIPLFMRHLSFSQWPISSNDIKILSQSQSVIYVERLDISFTNVGDDGIVAIFSQESKMFNLIHLQIQNMPQLTSKSMNSIFKSPIVNDSFEITDVMNAYKYNNNSLSMNEEDEKQRSNNKFKDSTVMILSYSKLLQNIKVLDLSHQINISTFSIAQIASSDYSFNIVEMNLDATAIDDTAILLIANSDQLLKLQKLSVNQCENLTENAINYFLRNQFLNYKFQYENFISYLIEDRKILEKTKLVDNIGQLDFVDEDQEDFQLDDQNVVLMQGSNTQKIVDHTIVDDQQSQQRIENRKKHDRLLNGLLTSKFRRDQQILSFNDQFQHGWTPQLDTISKYFSQKNFLFLEELNLNLRRTDNSLLQNISESEILPFLRRIILKNGQYTSEGLIYLIKGQLMAMLDPSSFIRGNGHLIDFSTLTQLGKSPLLVNCTVLDLQGAYSVREDEWKSFFDNLTYLSNNLTYINLRQTKITNEALYALFSPQILPKLEDIDISEDPKIQSNPFEYMINQKSKPFIHLKELFQKLPTKMFENSDIHTQYPQIYFDRNFLDIPDYLPPKSFLLFLKNPMFINIRGIKISQKYRIQPEEIEYFEDVSTPFCVRSIEYPSLTQDFLLAMIRNQKLPFQKYQLLYIFETSRNISTDNDVWLQLSKSQQFLTFQTLTIDMNQKLDLETYKSLLKSENAMGLEEIEFIYIESDAISMSDSEELDDQASQEAKMKHQLDFKNQQLDFQKQIINTGVIPSQFLKNLREVKSDIWDFQSFLNLIKNYQNFSRFFIEKMINKLSKIPLKSDDLIQVAKNDLFYTISWNLQLQADDNQLLDIPTIFSNQYQCFTRRVKVSQKFYNEKDLLQISSDYKRQKNLSLEVDNTASITPALINNWIKNQHMNPYRYEYFFNQFHDQFNDIALTEYASFYIDPQQLPGESGSPNAFFLRNNVFLTYRGIRNFLNITPNRFEEINLSGMQNMNDRVLTAIAQCKGVSSCSKLILKNMNVIQNRGQQIKELNRLKEIRQQQALDLLSGDTKAKEQQQERMILQKIKEEQLQKGEFEDPDRARRQTGQYEKYVTFKGLRRLMLQKNNFNPQIFRFEYLLDSLKQSFKNVFSRKLLKIIADTPLLGNLSSMELNGMILNPLGLRDMIQSAELRNLSQLDLSNTNVDGKTLQLIGGCVFSYNLQKLKIDNCREISDWKYIIMFLNGKGIKDSENFDFESFANCFLQNIELIRDTSFFSQLVQTHYFQFHMNYFSIFKYINIFKNKSIEFKNTIQELQSQRKEEIRNLDQQLKDLFNETDMQNYEKKKKQDTEQTEEENLQLKHYEQQYSKLCYSIVQIFSNTPDLGHQSKKQSAEGGEQEPPSHIEIKGSQQITKQIKTWSRSFDIARFFIDEQNLDLSNLIQDIDLMRIIKRYFTLQFFSLQHYTQLAKGINYLIQLPNDRFSSIYQIAYLKHPRFQKYISVGSIKYLAEELIKEKEAGKSEIKAGYSLVTNLNFSENHYLSTFGLADFLKHSDYTRNWFQLNPDKDFDMNNLDFLTANEIIDDQYMNHFLVEIFSACYGIQFINLSNQNLSDEFIIKLSQILNTEIVDDFPNLEEINITNNPRITHIGLKFLFANTLDRIIDGRLQVILREKDSWEIKRNLILSNSPADFDISQSGALGAPAAAPGSGGIQFSPLLSSPRDNLFTKENLDIQNIPFAPEENDDYDEETLKKQIDQYDIMIEGKGKGRTLHYSYNDFTKKYQKEEEIFVKKSIIKVYMDQGVVVSKSKYKKNQMMQYPKQRQRLQDQKHQYLFKSKEKEKQAQINNLGIFQINQVKDDDQLEEQEQEQDDLDLQKSQQLKAQQNLLSNFNKQETKGDQDSPTQMSRFSKWYGQQTSLQNSNDEHQKQQQLQKVQDIKKKRNTLMPKRDKKVSLDEQVNEEQQEEEEFFDDDDNYDEDDDDNEESNIKGTQVDGPRDNKVLRDLVKKIASQKEQRKNIEISTLSAIAEKRKNSIYNSLTRQIATDSILKIEEGIQDDEIQLEKQSDDIQSESEQNQKEIQSQQKEQQFAIQNYQYQKVEGTNFQLVEQYEKDLQRISRDHQQKSRIGFETERLSMQIFMRQIAEIGVYQGINYNYRTYWKYNQGKLILIAICGLPFAVFQLYKILESLFLTFLFTILQQFSLQAAAASISSFIINKIRKHFKSNQKKLEIQSEEKIKPVPVCMFRKDKELIFYFDNEVLLLNQYLSQNQFVLLNARTADGKIARNQFQWISYLRLLLILNMFFYYMLAIVYPIVVLPNCDDSIYWYDFPYYSYALLVFILELMLLFNVSSIISSDKIFNIYSLSTLTSLYVSVISQYDFYTDVLFATKTWYCEDLESRDISITAMIILSINMLYTFIYIKNSIQKIRQIGMMKQNWHSTNYIDEFARLCFVCEMHSLGVLLEKFSTSSSVSLSYNWYVPDILQGLLIPQVIVSQFQRVYLQDIPQIILQIIFFTTRQSGNPLEWDNMKVYLTSALSLFSSLGVAWDARPSLFDHSLFQELQFFFKLNYQQKVKLMQEEEKKLKISDRQQFQDQDGHYE